MRFMVLFGVLGVAGAQVIAQEDTPEVTAEEDNPNREVEEPGDEEGDMNEGEEGDAIIPSGSGGTDITGQHGWHFDCHKKQCNEGEGDCNRNSECSGKHVCKMNACRRLYHKGRNWKEWADCCGPVGPFDWDYCKLRENGPCDKGEGDCDCHSQCAAGLKCGVNNCRAMHPHVPKHEMHKRLDCCTQCSEVRVGKPWALQKMEAEYFDAQKRVEGTVRNLVKPPAVFEPAAVWNLPSLEDGDVIKLKCCKRKGSKCQFFVTVYHCKPCSESLNGGLPGTLLGSGWSSGSCAPRFEFPGEMGKSHAMTSFHMTLYAGQKVVVPINKAAPHVAVYERTGHIDEPWCPIPTGPHPPGLPCECIQQAR